MTLLAIFGCAPSTRELPSTLEGLSIEAVIDQSTEVQGPHGEGYSFDHVRVVLQDKEGRTLEREDLQVEMNDAVLGMRAAHGNFYDRHPFYRLDDASNHLAPDTLCEFAVVRPDHTHHAAGTVRTPKALVPAQFTFPAVASRREGLAITWTDLAEPAELVVFRSLAYTDLTGNTVLEGGTVNDPDALRRTIGPGLFRRASGRLEVPRSYLADHDERHVCGLGVEITVTREGEVRDPFSRKSSIRATRRLVLRADLVG